MSVVFVTYWWGNTDDVCENTGYDFFLKRKTNKKTYGDLVETFKNNMKKYKLSFHIEHVAFPKKYSVQDKINYKPIFITKMIKRFRKPILYMDIDMHLHASPLLFTKTDGHYDFMAFNWNSEPRLSTVFDWLTLETSGGIMYFNNSKPAIKLLTLWKRMLRNNKNKADDRVLAMAFVHYKAYKFLKFYWIPMEYFYVPQYFHGLLNHRHVVVSHPNSMTSENRVLNKINMKSRVPKDYDKIVTSRIQNFATIEESCVSHPIIKSVTKNRNKHLNYKLDQKLNCKHTKTINPYDIFLWSNFYIK